MAAGWYYMDGPVRLGPVPPNALRAALAMRPEPGRVLVWREGMPGWSEAGRVAELAGELDAIRGTRRPPTSSLAPPQLPGRIAIAKTADRYRRLVLLLFTLLAVAVGILVGVATIGAEMSPGLVGLVVPQLYLIVGALTFAMAYHAYCVAEGVGLELPILWVAAVVAPGLNVVALVVLYFNAQAWCRQHGIDTGLFGPSKASIDDFRRS